jgi:glutathione peroxidase
MCKQMIVLSTTAIVFLATVFASKAAEKEKRQVAKALSFTMQSLSGQDVDLERYQGKVVMIVNVASKCGLTPQYKQLQALHERHSKDGLAILGFPCNQFGQQEPGTADEIKEFCQVNYGVGFDMFAKIEVNGDGACDLYKYLTALDAKPKGPGKIAWNFEKFIIVATAKWWPALHHRPSPTTPRC